MIEWRVVERREPAAWSDPNSQNHGLSETKRPGLLGYIVAGLTVIATGVLAVFAFSFVLLVVLPLLAVAGLVTAWRWRRVIRKHQQQFQNRQDVPSDSSRRATRMDRQGDVIDV